MAIGSKGLGRGNNGVSVTGGSIMQPPSDIIPEDEKELTKWMHQWSDFLFRYGSICLNERDIENYNYAKGILDEAEFSEAMKLYTSPKADRVLPVRIPRVNSIARILNDVLGNVDEQNLPFSVTVVNEDAITEKLDHMVEKATEDLTRLLRQRGGVNSIIGRPLEEGDDVMPVDPMELQQRNMTNFHQENEIMVSKALKYLVNKPSTYLKWKFVHQGLYNYLITQKLAFDTNIQMDDPNADPIDTRLMVYELESMSPFIHKGRFAGYYFGLTPQEAVDRCPGLTEEDVAYINSLQRNYIAQNLDPSNFWYVNTPYRSFCLTCMQQYWKGLRKRLVKISPNKFDESNPHVLFVSEAEHKKWKKKEAQLKAEGRWTDTGVRFEYRYFTIVFRCTRIGEKVYYNCEELPNQLVDEESPSEQDLPLIGIVDEIPGLVTLLAPLETMRVQAWKAIKLLLNQPMGNVLVVDEAMEEDGQENLYNMQVFRVYKYNSAKEGEMQLNNQKKAPTVVDMDMSNAMNQLMRFIGFIDQNMITITGLNEPFMGSVKSDQGLGVTQIAQQSAQRALQPYYNTYYTVIGMVLQRLCDLMRSAWEGREVTRNWMGDKMAEWFTLSPDSNWPLARYGVFVQNNVPANARRQQMIQMASQLLPIAKEPDLAFAIIRMFNSDSPAEAEQIFREGVEAAKKIREQDMQMQAQQMQIQQESAQAIAQSNRDSEQIKAQTDIKVAEIKDRGDTTRKMMDIEHMENAGSVEYKNKIAELLAARALEDDAMQKQKNQ